MNIPPPDSSFAQSYDSAPIVSADDKTMPVFGLLSLVFSIIAGLAANRGEWYDIPVIGPIARQQSGL